MPAHRRTSLSRPRRERSGEDLPLCGFSGGPHPVPARDPGDADQGGGLDPRPVRRGDRADRCAARADDRQRDAVRGGRPDDAQLLPAEPRRPADPPHPTPDPPALDERQGPGLCATLPAEVIDRQQPSISARPRPPSPPSPATTTTAGSAANSTGRRRPSG